MMPSSERLQPSTLSEHESPDKVDNISEDREPTAKEKATLKLVEKLYSKGKLHKRRYDERWLDYYKFFRGKQWLMPRPEFRSSSVVNLVWQTIQSSIPIMTDSRPKVDFLPVEPGDAAFAEILNKLFAFDWEKNNWSEILLEALYDSHIYGTGIAQLEYDSEANANAGSVTFETVDPFYLVPDPNSTDVDKNCHWIITAIPTDIEVVKRKYPKKAKYIKADMEDLRDGSKYDLGVIKARSPENNNILIEGTQTDGIETKDKTLVLTLWIKDDEIIENEIKEKDENGKEVKAYERKLKYPKGRKIVISGKTVLEDGESEYEDGKYPFARIINYNLPREFWGVSEVEQLEEPQKTFNKILSFALDTLILMGNPIWIVGTDSGIDTEEGVLNQPGVVLEPEPNSRVERVEGVHLQPFVLQLADSLERWFNGISGNQEISSGVKPVGVTAASAIDSLADLSRNRLRLKMRNMDRFLRQVGRLYISRVMQYYTQPQVIRITNDQNGATNFKMHIDVQEDGTKVAKLREMDDQGRMGEERQYIIHGDFDVRATTASGLPFARAEREQKHFDLFDRGIIDAEEVLRGIEFPNWESILERMAQKAAAMPPGGTPQ